VIVSDDDKQQVVIYDGSRQQVSSQTGAYSRLDFDRYTIDLPEAGPVRQRWKEPDERTLLELIFPDEESEKNAKTMREFKTEIHRRFVSPFLAITYTLISLCCLLLGDLNRRGLGGRIVAATGAVIMLQGLYLVAYNLAKENMAGLVLMYGVTFVPLALAYYLLTPASYAVRQKIRQQWVKVMA
jgi:lipopolysaccharide export system permease protein